MKWRYRGADKERALDGLNAEGPEEVWAAMQRLGELNAKDASPKIILVMQSRDDFTAHVAAGVLARLQVSSAIPALVKTLKTLKGAAALQVLEALSAFDLSLIRKALAEISASHSDLQVREKANELLARTAD
jgi:hypothetical protein